MWSNVDSALTDPHMKDYSVIFTGHSLGGALASIAAMRCVLDGRRTTEQVKLVTFGQPRVGNVDFAMKHDELVPYSFRVVHRLDVVPHLPACKKVKDRTNRRDDSKPCNPNSKKKAYHHGTEIWYPTGMGEGAKYYECLGEPKNEDFDCSDSLSFEFSKYDTYISDHRHYFGHR
uniref:Lipase_3 domain-containing protein n=1 Tax=Steinernema glaseri TaxID=37863 RepID=A0A1I7ZCH7_9BILA